MTFATESLCKALAILKDGDFTVDFEILTNLAIGNKRLEDEVEAASKRR